MELDLGEWQLRGWRSEDKESLVRYANNHNVWINLRDSFPHPYTLDDAKAWIRSNQGQSPVTNFAIASVTEVIGSIGLRLQEDVYRRSAEIGYWLGEPFWNRGIATKAVRAVIEYGFATLGLERIYADVFQWNDASARVLEKAGFMLEGRLRKSVIKDGKIVDSLLYACVK